MKIENAIDNSVKDINVFIDKLKLFMRFRGLDYNEVTIYFSLNSPLTLPDFRLPEGSEVGIGVYKGVQELSISMPLQSFIIHLQDADYKLLDRQESVLLLIETDTRDYGVLVYLSGGREEEHLGDYNYLYPDHDLSEYEAYSIFPSKAFTFTRDEG